MPRFSFPFLSRSLALCRHIFLHPSSPAPPSSAHADTRCLWQKGFPFNASLFGLKKKKKINPHSHDQLPTSRYIEGLQQLRCSGAWWDVVGIYMISLLNELRYRSTLSLHKTKVVFRNGQFCRFLCWFSQALDSMQTKPSFLTSYLWKMTGDRGECRGLKGNAIVA